MADTNTKTPEPSELKKHYDYVNSLVDEQTILDKYNAATMAQYAAQREQNRQAENQFYNQMYNTQNTAMDTIRKANAAAVSTGASRGVQAANELSAILGLQNESIASATELAQANRQTAQEETAAVLENVLNAYQTAQQERANLLQSSIEAASIEQSQQAANQQAARLDADALQKASETGFANYMTEIAGQNKNYKDAYSLEGSNSLNLALNSLTAKGEGQANDGVYFNTNDFAVSGTSDAAIQKTAQLKQYYQTISDTYGLDLANDKDFQDLQNTLTDIVNKKTKWTNTGAGKFINLLTLGGARLIEDATTGQANGLTAGMAFVPGAAQGQAIGNAFKSGATQDSLRSAAQTTYTLLNNYIKQKYNQKQAANAQ